MLFYSLAVQPMGRSDLRIEDGVSPQAVAGLSRAPFPCQLGVSFAF